MKTKKITMSDNTKGSSYVHSAETTQAETCYQMVNKVDTFYISIRMFNYRTDYV